MPKNIAFALLRTSVLLSTLQGGLSTNPYHLSHSTNHFGDEFFGKVGQAALNELWETNWDDLAVPVTSQRSLSSALTISSMEYTALSDIYSKTSGNYWRWKPEYIVFGVPWNFTSGEDPCSAQWQGVGCVCPVPGVFCVITELDLFGKNLHGNIPVSISDLPYLAYLNLGANCLHGTIPKELGSLSGLQYLFLYANSLTGPLPIEIYGIKPLIYLVLGQVIDFNRVASLEVGDGLSGNIPDEIHNLTNLEYLYVYDTLLSGTIPYTLGSLTKLKAVVLSASPFTGTLPSTLTQLRSLEFFVFGLCRLTGTIPAEIRLLTNLTSLSLNSNCFEGKIPSEIFSLSKVQLFYLFDNALTGTIPKAVASFSSAFVMEIYGNRLTGTIPTEFAQLSALSFLDISSNHLHGNIPDIFGRSMPALSLLNVAFNSLSGRLPSDLGNMYSLNYLNTSFNLLTGPIPDSMGSLQNINFVSFQHNSLSGQLPSSLAMLTTLQFLDIGANKIGGIIPGYLCSDLRAIISVNMSRNRFVGGVPSCLSELSNSLSFLDMSYNSLGGTLPSNLGSLTGLQYLNIENAAIVGTLPSSIGSLSNSILDLRLSKNQLRGILPSSLCSLTRMSYFDVSHNSLFGTFPAYCLSNMKNIAYVFLQDNAFTGGLREVWDPFMPSKLQVFDIGANAFSGSLPYLIFSSSPALRAFSAIRNCFYGEISEKLCKAESLVELSLDGIGAAEACQLKYLPFSTSYAVADEVRGTVPRCLYALPNIKLLHLSGNGIRDHIPKDINISSSMVDLVLSHNLMYGEIPRSVQERKWVNLDLSFNKFSGTLVDTISRVAPGSALFLNVNRISGQVPSNLKTAQNISVLDGNLFSCALYTDDQSLPDNDENSAVYQCADTFTQLSFVWASPFFMSLMGVTLILVVLQLKSSAVTNWVRHKLQLSRRWIGMLAKDATLKSGRTNTVYLLLSFVQDFRRTSLIVSAYILIILLPTWLVLNYYFSTYEYLYAWTASSAYLSGVIPAVVMLLTLIGMLVCVFSLYQDNIQKDSSRKTSMFVGGIEVETRKSKIVQYICLAVCIVLNVVIIFVVNMIYVYVVISYNRVYATLAALAMAGLNLLWNNVIIVRVLQILRDALVPGPDVHQVLGAMRVQTISGDSAIVSVTPLQRKFEQRAVAISCIMELVNKIAIPCFATSAISSTCFRSIFVPPRVIRAFYNYTVCSVQPFLTYSCGIFATVEVCTEVSGVSYACTGSALAEKSTQYDPPFFYSYQCSAMFISSYAASYVYMFIVIAFGIPLAHSMMLLLQKYVAKGSKTHDAIEKMLPPALRAVSADFVLPPHAHLFDKSRFVIASVSYTAILVTFGAVFPPLAVVICFAIICKSHFLLLILGRLLENAEELGIARYRNTLLEECQDVAKSVGHQIWLLIPFAALFYSFFVFDTYGDAEGYEGAMIPGLMMAVVVPALFFAVKRCRDMYARKKPPPRRKITPRDRTPTKAVIETPVSSTKISQISAGKPTVSWVSAEEDCIGEMEMRFSSGKIAKSAVHPSPEWSNHTAMELADFDEEMDDLVMEINGELEGNESRPPGHVC